SRTPKRSETQGLVCLQSPSQGSRVARRRMGALRGVREETLRQKKRREAEKIASLTVLAALEACGSGSGSASSAAPRDTQSSNSRASSAAAATFFFSSRRRHTRCYRDWSSDVCSSDFT